MDTIKALQIIMAAISASIIRELYDSNKQAEPLKQFFIEALMSTLIGAIIGFVIQKYISDTMCVLGISAGAATLASGPESLGKIIKILIKLRSISIKIDETENDDESKK